MGVHIAALTGGSDAPKASLITIDRAERRNALDVEHCQLLTAAVIDRIEAGDRALVITGEGSAFCAGADFDAVASPDFRGALFGLLHSLTTSPVPIVAAVNGYAIGAGLQLAIASDLRVAAASASFGVPTARLGLAVDPWTIERLVALIGGGPARHLLLTCSTISASDAATAGLVDRIGSLGDATALAADMATMAPLTMRYIKLAVDGTDGGEHVVHDADVKAAFEACWTSRDFREGLRARAEKRPARFEGR